MGMIRSPTILCNSDHSWYHYLSGQRSPQVFGVSANSFLFHLGFAQVFIRLCLCVCFSLTFEAENSKFFCGVWESGLVFVLVERADPQQASSALRPGDGDGVARAAVGEPAVITAVQPLLPSGKQLSCRSHHGVVLDALVLGLLQREFSGERGIENLTCGG